MHRCLHLSETICFCGALTVYLLSTGSLDILRFLLERPSMSVSWRLYCLLLSILHTIWRDSDACFARSNCLFLSAITSCCLCTALSFHLAAPRRNTSFSDRSLAISSSAYDFDARVRATDNKDNASFRSSVIFASWTCCADTAEACCAAVARASTSS